MSAVLVIMWDRWQVFPTGLPAALVLGAAALSLAAANPDQGCNAPRTSERRIAVEGTVTGPDGAPVVNALVAEGTTWGGPRMQTARTDRQGRYRLADCRPGKTVLTVVAPGFAPDLRRIAAAPDMQPVDFRLKQGHTLRVRIVDKHEKPIPEAYVGIPWWRDCCTLTKVGIPSRSDSEGRWVWTWAPQEPIELFIVHARHACLLTGTVAPCKGEYVFTLSPRLCISGRVLDGETNEPIQRYRLILRSAAPHPRDTVGGSREAGVTEHSGGRYKVRAGGACRAGARVVCIEAPGYQPGISRPIQEDEGNVVLDIFLRRAGT